jgi:predicted DNA-binding transcriptional regulator AlpA
MNTPQTDLIPKPALARELGVSSRTVSRWMEDQDLNFPPPIRLRGRLYFPRALLEEWKSNRIRAVMVEAV